MELGLICILVLTCSWFWLQAHNLGYKAGLWICILKLDSVVQTVRIGVLPSVRSEDAQPSIEAEEDAEESFEVDEEDELSTDQIRATRKVNSIATIEAL
jgi:hypothetical protein